MKVLGNYDLEGSYTYTKLDFDRAANPDVKLNFNTPEHKFKASFGNHSAYLTISDSMCLIDLVMIIFGKQHLLKV